MQWHGAAVAVPEAEHIAGPVNNSDKVWADLQCRATMEHGAAVRGWDTTARELGSALEPGILAPEQAQPTPAAATCPIMVFRTTGRITFRDQLPVQAQDPTVENGPILAAQPTKMAPSV